MGLILSFRVQGLAGQFQPSPDLTLNGGSYREWYQNGLELGLEIILNHPGLGFRVKVREAHKTLEVGFPEAIF